MKTIDTLYRQRLNILSKYITIVFIILCIVLFNIQVVAHEDLSAKADNQNNIAIVSNPVRGNILDRNGIPFTESRDEIYLKVFPKLIGSREDILQIIGDLSGQNIFELKRQFQAKPQETEIIVSNLDYDLIEEVMQGIYPGIYIYANNRRYDENSIARHIVGYIQKDGSPIMGIEKEFHVFLDGNGESHIYGFKDAKDNPISGAGYRLERSNTVYHDVQLTIDYHIQKLLEQVLDDAGGRNGAIVVEIDSGEILAAASRPNYKQYDIAGSSEPDCFWAVPFKAFPPGSIFKTVVAAIAIEEGKYSGEDMFFCNGGIDLNGVFYPCHKSTGGLGEITLEEAFAHSCNDAFIRIAKELGGDKVVEFARKFGFGSEIDIGFDNDIGGLPDRFKFAGAGIGNLALGQGDVMVTPLQAVDMMTTIANGGIRKPLKLVRRLISSDGTNIEWKSETEEYRVISNETAKELQTWLIQAARYGTGKRAYDEEFGGGGGKTGTPQIANDIYAEHYGWFVGFFPVENPKYAMAILSREEGEGGTTAAPIFKEIARGIWRYNSNLKYVE